MTEVTPPNIWRYNECSAVNTDGVNMKEYKPVGQFYQDLSMLQGLYGIKTHPCLKEPSFPIQTDEEAVAGFED